MSIWGKIFGGTSGFVVGGPLGGLLGIFAGHAIDKFNKKKLPERIAVCLLYTSPSPRDV